MLVIQQACKYLNKTKHKDNSDIFHLRLHFADYLACAWHLLSLDLEPNKVQLIINYLAWRKYVTSAYIIPIKDD